MRLLPPEEYEQVWPLVSSVEFATLSFTPVLKGVMEGCVFLSAFSPKVSYISNAYGMSLLCGAAPATLPEEHLRSFTDWLRAHIFSRKRTYMEWLQAYPNNEWKEIFDKAFPSLLPTFDPERTSHDSFALCERINYRYNLEHSLPAASAAIPEGLVLSPLLLEHFPHLDGAVVPMHFWKSDTWATKGGAGFLLSAKSDGTASAGQPVSWSFSSGVTENQLELGIETVEAFRGKGLARLVCDRLLVYCAERGLDPIWCCRKSNVGSMRLAEALGFRKIDYPFGPIHYYHLPAQEGGLSLDYRKL